MASLNAAGRLRRGARIRAAALLFCALLCLLPGGFGAHADEAYSEDAVKAAFLYRFTGYVEWPTAVHPATLFTIAVYEADGVAHELQRLLPVHPINGLPAQVRSINNIRELGDAQMLYIGPGHAETLRTLIASVGTHPVLLVTDDENGLGVGGALNFLTLDKRVRFEVSLTAAERMGLKISSELLSVAIRVQGGRLRSGVFCTPNGEPDSLCNFSLARLHDGRRPPT
jgi:hypothetical protein